MKSYFVLANDSNGFKGRHLSKFPGKTHYLGLGHSKLKAAHPVNYFPGFLVKLRIAHPVIIFIYFPAKTTAPMLG